MTSFFTIYCVMLLAFANSQQVIMVTNPDDSDVYKNSSLVYAFYLSYLVSAGEFMLDDGFGDAAVTYRMILFVLSTVTLMIIMLNLFIAIISDVFASVSQQGERASFREYASLIAENQ